MDGINTFTCLCPPGFTGSYCQHDINECDSKPCLNGGTCLDSYGTYKCTCPHGYTGLSCQVGGFLCSKAVANAICVLHNVVQITFEPSASVISRFFYLLHTFLSLNQSSPACFNEINLSLSLCLCTLQNLVRWCESSPCKNGGTCWQRGTTYSCECETGWTGLYCDVPSVSCEVAAKQRGKAVVNESLY